MLDRFGFNPDYYKLNKGLKEMLKGEVTLDFTTPEQAIIAESTGAVAVMALEYVPADIRRYGEVARMSDPILGTCAGMILLARHTVNQDYVYLGIMDIWVRRNAYGSQIDSFIKRVSSPPISNSPLEIIFIRAPDVEKIGEEIEVILELDGKIVAVRQDKLLATAFHSELTDDLSFHKYFLEFIKN